MAKDVLTAVRGTSQLSVDVSELLRRPGATRTLQFRYALEGLTLPLARVEEGSELSFDLRLESLVDGIHARGTVRAALQEQCRRCLRALSDELEAEIDALFVSPGELDDDDSYPIVEETVDLEPVARDAIILNAPLNPLCREDCKGLCTVCGADRNETECGHAEEKSDLRWEALARLRERLEE